MSEENLNEVTPVKKKDTLTKRQYGSGDDFVEYVRKQPARKKPRVGTWNLPDNWKETLKLKPKKTTELNKSYEQTCVSCTCPKCYLSCDRRIFNIEAEDMARSCMEYVNHAEDLLDTVHHTLRELKTELTACIWVGDRIKQNVDANRENKFSEV